MTKQVETVDTLIAKAIRSAVSSTKAIQAAAEAVLVHAAKHNDYSKANTLVDGIRASHRADSLVAWFVRFGGFSSSGNKGEDGKAKFDGWKGPEYIRENYQAARAMPWQEAKKESDPFAFDYSKKIHAFLKSVEGAAKKKEELAKENPEAADRIKLPTAEQLDALKAAAKAA